MDGKLGMDAVSTLPLGWVSAQDSVEVRCWDGLWYTATCLETFDYPDTRTVLVTFNGWTKRHDEWIGDASRVRAPRDRDDTLLENDEKKWGDTTGAVVVDGEVFYEVAEVVKVLPRGNKPCLVRWAGWEGHEHECTWVPKHNVPQEFLDAYEAKQRAKDRKREA